MGSMVRRAWAQAVMAALVVGSTAAPAHAANLLDNFWLPNDKYSGDVPACTEPLALGTISNHFAETERMYWKQDANIVSYSDVHEIAFKPWGEGFVPRRYCRATVITTDSKRQTMYYSIIEDGGFQGFTWGVEWCMAAYDRNFAYAPNCKMAQP